MRRNLYLVPIASADVYINDLLSLYAELQSTTMEAAHPGLDLFTFVESLHHYALVVSVPAAKTDLPPIVLGETIFHSYEDPSVDWNTKLGGFVYLQPSQDPNVPHDHVAELSMGLILDLDHRGKGVAEPIVKHMLEIAFSDKCCHRVQAVIIDAPSKPQALSLFVNCGFTIEGTRRKCFLGPYDHMWKDVSYLAVLDTDYVLRKASNDTFTRRSLWDEMLSRHQRESEQLLLWENRRPLNRLKRSASTETIRDAKRACSPAALSDEDTKQNILAETIAVSASTAHLGATGFPRVVAGDDVSLRLAGSSSSVNLHQNQTYSAANSVVDSDADTDDEGDGLFSSMPSLRSVAHSTTGYSTSEYESDNGSVSGDDWTSDSISNASSPPRSPDPFASPFASIHDNTASDGDVSESGLSSTWDYVSDQETDSEMK